MSRRSEGGWESLRQQVLGLGESSARKSHYPSLRQRVVELERFRRVLDLSSDLLLIVDLESQEIRDANQAAAEELGARAGQRLSEVLPEEVGERLRGLGGEGGALVECEVRERVYYEIAVRCGTDGEGAHAVLAARNVTGQRRTQAALAASEQRLRTIYDTMSDAVFVHDAESGRVLDVNGRACAMYGRVREEMLGLEVRALSADGLPYGQEQARMRLEAAAAGQAQEFEWRARRSDGSCFWVEVQLTAAELEGRACVLALVRDISERKAFEERSQQSQRLESLGQLAGGVAHEFNNLLTVINGYGSYLAQVTAGQEAALPAVSGIRAAGERAAELVQQMLAFGRRSAAAPRRMDLNEAVRRAEALLTPLVGERVEWRCTLAEEPLLVIADEGQIHQVVVNLAVNARDAMAGGGRLEILTREWDSAQRWAGAPAEIPAGRYVVLTVADTGCGIDPAAAARIFDPFFTTKPAGQGTGLGLSMVFGIVRQSQGWIWFESRVGEGTRFHVCLPRVEGEAVVAAPAAARPVGRGSGVVLVVEDQALVRGMAVEILRRSGYETLEAGDANEALAVAEAHAGKIDLLLTDLVMPGRSGRELAGELSRRQPGLRVILTSGYTEEMVAPEGLTSEIRFLPKPYSAGRLVEAVERALGRSAGAGGD